MNDVIREATILIRYKAEKSKLEGPELSQAVKAHEEIAKASERTARAYRHTATAAKDLPPAVPADWDKLFKSRADARNFAYQQHGERGLNYLKDDPEHIATLKRHQIWMEQN